MRKLGLVVLFCGLAAPAVAQQWFQHQFGELRAYHKDWLAVCADNGAGACRIVQAAPDPGSDSVFDQRLSVRLVNGGQDWAVQVMDRGMNEQSLRSMWFIFDGEEIRIPFNSYIPGEIEYSNVAETITVTNAKVALDLVARMKAGNQLVIRYEPVGNGNGEAQFSLRGFTSGSNAISARVNAR